MKKNIIFVVSHPIQYFVPLYQEMAKNEEAHVKVLYCTDETMKGGIDKMFGVKVKWDIPLLDGYESKFMTNHAFKPNMNTFWGLLNLGLIKELWKAPKSLVIINGWQFSTYVMAYFFARLFGHKVGTRSEAPFYKEFNRPSISKSIRKFVLGNLFFKYFIDFFFYIGNQNKKFYQYFNVKDNQLFYAPYAVDNERFMRATNLSDAEKTALKQELNIPEQSHIALFTGKFYSVKRPLDLLEAIKNLNQPDLYLVMVGDGILRPEMEEFIKAHNLTNVRITGFVNQTQIPAYYALADVLVLCSETETWGLSVNEAMCASLPIIVSNTVGCADDLVQNGVNGFIFETGNVAQLSDAIKTVVRDENFRIRAGKKSLDIIQHFTYQKVVDNILKAELSNE